MAPPPANRRDFLASLSAGTRYRHGHQSKRDGSATLTQHWKGVKDVEELNGLLANYFPGGIEVGPNQTIPLRTTEAIALGGNDWIGVARYSKRRKSTQRGGGGVGGERGVWDFTPTSETMEWYTYPFMINKEGKQDANLSQIYQMMIWPGSQQTHEDWKSYSTGNWRPGTLTKFRREIATLRATLTLELDYDPRNQGIWPMYNTINRYTFKMGHNTWPPLTLLFNPPKIRITGNGPAYDYETTWIIDVNPTMWVRQINSSNNLLQKFKHPVAYVPQYRVWKWGSF